MTDDNPRTEDPAFVRAGVRAGAEEVGGPTKIIEVAGRRAAEIYGGRILRDA